MFSNTSAALANLNPLQLLGLGTTTYDQTHAPAGSIATADPYSTGGYKGGNGWTYYNDGSAVDPEGSLWWQGQKVGNDGSINQYESASYDNVSVAAGSNWI